MADDLELPFPHEILLQIVEASLPAGGPDRIVDIGQCQTLVAFTRVCRATYAVATRLIRRHCIYLDSESRMRRFKKCLQACEHPAVKTLPPTPSLKSTASMFLGPYQKGWWAPGGQTFLIRDILVELAPTLRRLVINIVRRTNTDEASLMPMLRSGLVAASNLEELVCIGALPKKVDNSFFKLRSSDPCPWPRLRRLALCTIDIRDNNFWRELAQMPSLEHVIMVRPFLLRSGKWNVHRSICAWWNHRGDNQRRRVLPLKFVFVDLEFSPIVVDCTTVQADDPRGLVSVFNYEVPLPLSARTRADHQCYQFAQKAALQDSSCVEGDTLWEWEGTEV